MKSFRTLDLSIEFYEFSEKSELKGNLRDQLLRAASSISLNLSEGNAKRTTPEKKRYYQMAYAQILNFHSGIQVYRLTRIQGSRYWDLEVTAPSQ